MVPFYVIFLALFGVSVGYALWKGGPPERLGAAVLVAMAVVQPIAHIVIPRQFDRLDVASLVADLMGFAGMTVIALYADRKWPLWTAALQLLACAAHVVRMLSTKAEPLVYGTMRTGPTFLVLIILVAGTVLHRRRLRRGSDRSWAKSPRPPAWIFSLGRSLEL